MSESLPTADETAADDARLQHDLRISFLRALFASGMGLEDARSNAAAWEAWVMAGASEMKRDARHALVLVQLGRGYTACAFSADRAELLAEAAHWVCLPLEPDAPPPPAPVSSDAPPAPPPLPPLPDEPAVPESNGPGSLGSGPGA